MQRKPTNNVQIFYKHVKELRNRVALSAGVFVAGGVSGYVFRASIIDLLRHPINSPLYYSTPAGNFTLIMQVSLLVGTFLALPVLVYNIVRFLEPALNNGIKHRSIVALSLLSVVLGATGLVFAYLVVLPLSIHFFQSYKIDGVTALISATSYLDFVIKCLMSFIFLFQIPMVILFINRIKPLSTRKLVKYEKYVIVGSLVIALVLPFSYDPLTQFVIAVPIIVLYNFSLLLVWFINRPRRKPAEFPRFAPAGKLEPWQPATVQTASAVAAPQQVAALKKLVAMPKLAPPKPITKPVADIVAGNRPIYRTQSKFKNAHSSRRIFDIMPPSQTRGFAE